MTVLNTFLAVAGWAWTVLVLFFAAGYAVGYKAGQNAMGQEKSQRTPREVPPIHSFTASEYRVLYSTSSGC
jgi:hypothetical protein